MSDISTKLADPQNPTYAYVGAFVDELRRSGLRHAVICPGSRSTPLALVLTSTPALHCWMHVDERSAAFFALGLAKRLDQPVALLCTSGTAAANFLPAIAEAHLTHVPLLVLTSDRPPELRECGAPQAIDQNRLYGTHAKWFMETALPEASNEALRYIRTIACRALAQTRIVPAGPVHLNMPFREPLTPAPIPGQPLPPEDTRDPLAWRGRSDDQPYIQVSNTRHTGTITEDRHWELSAEIGHSPRGLILVGPQNDPELVAPLLQLARKTGYPILADPLSQVRGKENGDELVISSYDAFLRSERFLACYEPQLILRFGAMLTSKPVLLYLKHYANCPQIIIDPHNSWEDPTQLARHIFYADAKNFCMELSKALDNLDQPLDETRQHTIKEHLLQPERVAWTEAWHKSERATRQALATAISDFTELFEGRVFHELAELLPTRSLLYTGNSMPVRDMDTFFWPKAKELRCLGNRGANGIDGVISSALGASTAGGSEEPAVLIIGDLSFFHDLNGLLAARLHSLHLVIVLIN
ncbi:MAG TPA: 2-succinyl-5-enolpyruvyl-6-hydroxy-3-cyclohexene-1-carboxylic-acid synthase, partial [Ktedonobacteraceae bacterium]|nr:2-succinyl-5-enolpyruvyl-6-hydroxy-3-cyclohexene-1-carboxylic-acid synthase [Ktedonobacteraceae bacterium]